MWPVTGVETGFEEVQAQIKQVDPACACIHASQPLGRPITAPSPMTRCTWSTLQLLLVSDVSLCMHFFGFVAVINFCSRLVDCCCLTSYHIMHHVKAVPNMHQQRHLLGTNHIIRPQNIFIRHVCCLCHAMCAVCVKVRVFHQDQNINNRHRSQIDRDMM